MIINGQALLEAAPIKDMLPEKNRDDNGVSYGLAEVGYDIRIKQDVTFVPGRFTSVKGHVIQAVPSIIISDDFEEEPEFKRGSFTLASSVEEFQMPYHLTGIVHDKSTWARLGLSVFNTVIEPGWHGWLTLELAFKGDTRVHIPAGSGIAQIIFHEVLEDAEYKGAYQNQADTPVKSALNRI